MCAFPDLHTSTPHTVQSQVSLPIRDLEMGDQIFSWLFLLVPWDTSQAFRPLAVCPTSEALVLHSVFSLLTHFRAFGWLVCGVRGKILARHLLTNVKRDFIQAIAVGERDFSIELNSTPKTALLYFLYLISLNPDYSLLLIFDQSLNPDYFAS